MPIALLSAILLSIAFLIIIVGATSYVIDLLEISDIFYTKEKQEEQSFYEKIIKKIKPPKK